MTTSPQNTYIQTFWQEYQDSLPAGHTHAGRPLPQAWAFGDGPAMADELGALVLDGIKTATCSLVWEYEAEGEPTPQEGDLSIVLDGQGRPLCLIETCQVEIKPFDKVEADFAYDEGEDDRTLESWQAGHQRFFTRACAALGRTPSPGMPVVCERFRLVWPVQVPGD